MQIALFAAILLIVISVPTAYAATLQLVTENGNVFSIDFDEILSIYSGYNSTAPILNNTAVNQEIQRLVNSIVMNNSTQDDIDDLQTQITDLLTQLNSNSTSAETEIERLGDLIANLTRNSDVTIDRLEQLIANLGNATESEITELNELLDELETDLLTQIDDLEDGSGVGAGALGSSGRLTTVPVGGILVHGTHTYYDTSGIINPTTPYFYTTDDFEWATLIDASYTKNSYDIPEFGVGYILADPNGNTIEIVEDIITGQLPELSVNGLPADTTWSITNFEDDFVRAGVTNSAGEVLIPRTTNDGVTITRASSFGSNIINPIRIPDYGTVLDTIHVSEFGIVNDIHITMDKSHTGGNIQLIAPSGNIYDVGSSYYLKTFLIDGIKGEGEQINGDWVLVYKNTSSTMHTLNSWTLDINYGNAGKVSSVTGSGNQYQVTVNQAYSGSYELSLMKANGIKDSSNYVYADTIQPQLNEIHVTSNAVIGPDRHAPLHVHSVERYSPTTMQTSTSYLEYLVTFNKNVKNVDWSDFTHLYSSLTNITTTQNTDIIIPSTHTALITIQSPTSSPNLTIDGTNTDIEDKINISGTNIINKINVTVDITHTHIGDLKVELFAPDGTIKTLHDRDGGSSDDIKKTFQAEFYGGVAVNGDWTLKINDNYVSSDDGILNSWSISYDVPDTTGISDTTSQTVSTLYPFTITNAKLVLDVNIEPFYSIDDLKINLIVPGGTNIEISDFSNTAISSNNGVYEFYLGELVGIDPASGRWSLTIPALTHDSPTTDETFGTIDYWSLEIEHKRNYGTVTDVRHKDSVTTYASQDDFALATGNDHPIGIAEYNNKFWIVDYSDDKVHAYDADDGTYSNSDSFSLTTGHDHARGITEYNNKFWIIDYYDDKVYVYNAYDGTYSSSNDFALATGNDNPTGIAEYNNKFWILDATDKKVYVYNAYDGMYIDSEDFDIRTEHVSPYYISYDNNKFWISNNLGSKMYVYGAVDKTYFSQEINRAPNNAHSQSVLYKNNKLWIVDNSDDKVYTYNVNGFDTSTNQFIVSVTAGSNQQEYKLWLKGINDIVSDGSNETFDMRQITFAPDLHEHYNRGAVSIPSYPHIRTITIDSFTSNSVIFNVIFSESVTGVDVTDFKIIENDIPETNPLEASYTNSLNGVTINRYTSGNVENVINVNEPDAPSVNVIDITVDIDHTKTDDLEIEITSPTGTISKIYDNVGLNYNFTIPFENIVAFEDENLNGDWTLRVRDNGSTASSGTLNSWSINFNYEDTPTYEELAQVTIDKGSQYTFVNVLAGPHKLNIYPNAPINNYCSGILFDAYNKESLCLPERDDKTATYDGNFHKPSGVANYNYTLPVTENLQVSKISLTMDSSYNLYNVDKFTLTSPTGEIIVDMDYYGERFESGTIFQKDYYFESKIPINGNWKLHFDDYYAHNVNFSIQFGDGTLIYTSNAYMRYPMTVPVNISGVGASNTDCDNNVISLNYLDNNYEAGDIMMVPIVPQMSVLCMSIERINTVIYLADVSPQVQLAVIPPTSSSGGVATSGTSFFATKTGNVNAIFDVSTGVGYDIRRTLDYTDRYEAHTCGDRLSNFGGNCQNDVMSNERSTWTSTVGAATSSSSTITTNINIYRNGILAANEKIINNDSIPIQIVASNVVPFSANQRIISNSNDLSINPVLGFYVESGDFVQLEITTYSRGSIALPPTEPATEYYGCSGSFYAGKVGGSVVYNIRYSYLGLTPLAPDRCDGYGDRNNGRMYESTTSIPSSVDPKPAAMIESTGTKWTKINGGYVIFTGS